VIEHHILAGVCLIVVETLLILALALQRVRRRKVETELEAINERLHLALEAGTSVGWEWDIKNGRDRWFGDLQTVFGIPSDDRSGRVEDFRRLIHPEDQDLVLKGLADARQNRKQYVAEFRVVRTDGIVRWITVRGKFRYAVNGEAERMLGMAVDITDRKMAEDTLFNLSGSLIDAQEEERKRIAREIHDDYQQQLAVLAIDLEQLAKDTGNSPVELSSRLLELWNRVGELGSDLHSLSHRLHSSTLESLGLVAGVRAFCEEFSEQHGMQVDFVHENVPRALPGNAALCLFRIAQEGVRNVKKHSGANRAEVRLELLEEKLHLSVSDHGIGFDSSEHSRRGGIGLRSMEERLRLLGGQLEIHSQSTRGTKIDAWIPFIAVSQREVERKHHHRGGIRWGT
jgi:PAS domain S-box-containing protein